MAPFDQQTITGFLCKWNQELPQVIIIILQLMAGGLLVAEYRVLEWITVVVF